MIAAAFATAVALYVFIRLFLDKFGLWNSLRAFAITWVVFFSFSYLGLGVFTGWVDR